MMTKRKRDASGKFLAESEEENANEIVSSNLVFSLNVQKIKRYNIYIYINKYSIFFKIFWWICVLIVLSPWIMPFFKSSIFQKTTEIFQKDNFKKIIEPGYNYIYHSICNFENKTIEEKPKEDKGKIKKKNDAKKEDIKVEIEQEDDDDFDK